MKEKIFSFCSNWINSCFVQETLVNLENSNLLQMLSVFLKKEFEQFLHLKHAFCLLTLMLNLVTICILIFCPIQPSLLKTSRTLQNFFTHQVPPHQAQESDIGSLWSLASTWPYTGQKNTVSCVFSLVLSGCILG